MGRAYSDKDSMNASAMGAGAGAGYGPIQSTIPMRDYSQADLHALSGAAMPY